jgi:hypothetical protein
LIIKILVLILTAYFFLNANVQYVVVKDLKLIFNGSNMLNLNNNRLISTSYNQSFLLNLWCQLCRDILCLELIIHYSFVLKIFFLEQNEVLDKIKVYIRLTQLRSLPLTIRFYLSFHAIGNA